MDDIAPAYSDRCRRCFMRNEVCICDLIPVIHNETPLTVLMHHREAYKTTNTARIACLALKNSAIYYRGLPEWRRNTGDPSSAGNRHKGLVDTKRQPILLTLSDKSAVLTREWLSQFNNFVQLIVPDGNWRQANKMGKREPDLKNIPWVKLPPGPPSRYFLRREHHPEGMSTLEAIARAFGIIENTKIQVELEQIFETMVTRTLSTRPPMRNSNLTIKIPISQEDGMAKTQTTSWDSNHGN